MTVEQELINKSYYVRLVEGQSNHHPIRLLGEMYRDENKQEMPDYSTIRFAQGEVYFRNKDYEAAVFKWENVDNGFKPWALKNIGDAHFEMGLLAIAEDYYKSVNTDSTVLQTEVLLQLFSLNKKLENHGKAFDSINQAVSLNPDYPGVTEIARTFYEQQQDWKKAVELAVREAIRTNSLSWYKVLEEYVDKGYTANIKPDYFTEVVFNLYTLDLSRFEHLITLLWNSYKQTDMYFPWITEINNLLLNVEMKDSYIWKKLPDLYTESYSELVSGNYLIKDFTAHIQHHLVNWQKIASGKNSLIASSAILAWNVFFPTYLDASLVEKAKDFLMQNSDLENSTDDVRNLYEKIKNWAMKEGLTEEEFLDQHVELDSNNLSNCKNFLELLKTNQAELENGLVDSIQWNEELLVKLNGVHHQLKDMEEDNSTAIKMSFRNIKNEFRQTLLTKITELLKSCSDVVKDDSDFSKLHIEINNEMNRRIAQFMEETAVHQFQDTIQSWFNDCQKDLTACQTFLDEMCESLENLYSENIILKCDFKVLEDWERDVHRITRGIVHLEKENIWMRSSLSQFLSKSVGTLLGQFMKNKEKLLNKYKQFIENADYSQTSQSIINPFIQQVELFENSIVRDINMFVSTPYTELNRVILDVEDKINQNKEQLNQLNAHPERFRDPITLFELQLYQFELMNSKQQEITDKQEINT